MKPDRFRKFVSRAMAHLGDRALSVAEEWNSPPAEVSARLLSQLGRVRTDSGMLEGEEVVHLRTAQGVTFAGPTRTSEWGCGPRRLALMREIARERLEIESDDIRDAHCALLHNVLVRYLTEFSGYPYSPFRTRNLTPGDTFIDIGAFRGFVSMKASRMVGPDGRVVAVEPIAGNAKYIRHLRNLNELDNLELREAVVTEQTGSTTRIFVKHNQVNSILPDLIGRDAREVQVANFSVDELTESLASTGTKRVIASITTNGTEAELAQAMLDKLRRTSVEFLDIVIPIIYADGDSLIRLFKTGRERIHSETAYPWLRLQYIR